MNFSKKNKWPKNNCMDENECLTFKRSIANFNTLLATVSSSFLCGFCSICKYKLICSVSSTDKFLYFLLILVPKVRNRSRKMPSPNDQTRASTFDKMFKESVSWKKKTNCELSVSLKNHRKTGWREPDEDLESSYWSRTSKHWRKTDIIINIGL